MDTLTKGFHVILWRCRLTQIAMKKRVVVIGLALLILSTYTPAAKMPPKPKPFRQFTTLEIEDFQNPKPATKDPMPDSWVAVLHQEIDRQVIRIHRFRRVDYFEDTKAAIPQTERVLLLRGKITEFKAGRGGKGRAFWGPGTVTLQVHCEFVDKASGEIIYETTLREQTAVRFEDEEVIKHLAGGIPFLVKWAW